MKMSAHEGNRKKLVWVILGCLLFYITLILVSDASKISENFSKIRIELVVLVLLIQFVSHIVRSFRQYDFLNELNIKISIKQNFLIYLAGNSLVATPGGVGTFVKMYYLKQKFNTSNLKTFPIVFLERYHDLLAASTIIFITILISFSWLSVTIVIISSFLLISVFFLIKNLNVFSSIHRRISKIKVIGKILTMEDPKVISFDQLTKPTVFVKGWSFSILGWSLDALAVYVGFLAFGIDLGFFVTTQIYFTSLGYGILSLLPGGIGITEGMTGYLLIKHGLEISVASSLVIFTRLSTIWFVTVLGMIFTRNALR